MKTILICGGRDFGNITKDERDPDYELRINQYYWAMDRLDELFKDKNIHIIHGNATGADTIADIWGRTNQKKVTPYPANWKKHGIAAGPIRNQQMLDEGKPDFVIAFPGDDGTADMCRRAKSAGIPVKKLQYNEVQVL